ncbi:hypothetical protein ACFQ7F_38110 [Streptomyces sp. NPDC056486]|uniref:hypothetical protein n=1 Tax=Streptomyces sp. NPDC056486 TaxID=3345835 RepID=UPI0036C2620B
MHEASHRIFQERPEILVPIFEILGIPLPEKAAVDVITPDTTENRPLERRVDSVLRIQPSDGDDFLLAIEAQGRREKEKESSWPYYIAYLRAKYDLPVLLLVVCWSRSTAKWATGPFTCGARGWTAQSTRPLVVGPDNVPVITEQRAVEENLAMASFSALTHSRGPEVMAILEPLARVVQGSDTKAVKYFGDLIEVCLGETPAGENWRELMGFVTYFPGRGTVRETAYLEGKAEGIAEGVAEGIAEERVVTILRILEQRHVPLPDDARERITTCTDLETLARWRDRAITVTDADALFAESPEPGE